MVTARRYTMEQIEAARKKLRSLPAKTVGKTRGEVAELLADDIRKAVRQGYILHDIKNLLAETGVVVSLAKMREVLTQSDGSGRQCSAHASETDTAPRLVGDALVSASETFPPTTSLNDVDPTHFISQPLADL